MQGSQIRRELSYPWRRFWHPIPGSFSLSDGGYLSDPDDLWGHAYHPQKLVTFEDIADVPCLALLGEPGIGKSSAVKEAYKVIEAQASASEDQTLWVDLRSCDSSHRVIQKIFENRTFCSWVNGSHRLHLFIDSLDECLLRVDTIATMLLEEFSSYSLDRLLLRVMCRTADWPVILSKSLESFWSRGAVQTYELVPLRRKDVVAAATVYGLDANSFLQAVDHAGVVGMANRPVTLQFLLQRYAENKGLRASRKELYHEGCLTLCSEWNESRRAARRTGNLTPEQRLLIAARIAAVTQFANRYAVCTEPSLGGRAEGTVAISDLCGWREMVRGISFDITEVAIREVVGTGLFSGRGAGLMGWAHQTYAEHLAAWYISEHQIPLDHILKLIIDTDGHVIPQIKEIVAWLAGQDPNVFRSVMKADPQVLLLSDVAGSQENDRAELVDKLLDLCEREELPAHHVYSAGRLDRLDHPGLPDQLRPYLIERNHKVDSRWVAIDIAEACQRREVQSELADIALDMSEPFILRTQAAYAVARIGKDAAKARMLPLARGEAGDDPDDELKGCGLKALWPGNLTAAEMFPLLTFPKNTNLFGAYQGFIQYGLVSHLQAIDLPLALAWAEEQRPQHLSLHPFSDTMQKILQMAWNNLYAPGVLDAFAAIAYKRLKNHDTIMGMRSTLREPSLLFDNDDKRRNLTVAIVSCTENAADAASFMVFGASPLVSNNDKDWLIQRLDQASSEHEVQIYSNLIYHIFMWTGLEDVAICDAIEKHPILNEKFAPLWKPIRLDSPNAQSLRESWQMEEEFRKRRDEHPILDPPPTERIVTWLDQFEAGDLTAWWQLNLDMTLKPDSRIYDDELSPKLVSLPGWEEADPETRERIISAAQVYLLEQIPVPNEWIKSDTLHRPDLAGYRAYVLLDQVQPGTLTALPDSVWQKWAAVILAYPVWGRDEYAEAHQTFVKRAYEFAPDEIISTLLSLIDKDNEKHGFVFILSAVALCWDRQLAQALVEKLSDPSLKPGAFGNLLEEILKHDTPNLVDEVKRAKEIAVQVILDGQTDTEDTMRQKRSLMVAAQMIYYAPRQAWSLLWPGFTANTAWGRSIAEYMAMQDHHSGRVISHFSEEQLGDLYLWLERQYPRADDPRHEGAYNVGPREAVADWRDSILRTLQASGTSEACSAIASLKVELPHLSWLNGVLLEAQETTRRKNWVPPTPQDIIRMAIRTDEQVQNIQCETYHDNRGANMSTNYNISGGQQGAVGDNAVAHDFTQQQVVPQVVDLKTLATQLGQVAAVAKDQAAEPEHQIQIGAIEAAKAAAEKGDDAKAVSFLKNAGQWVLDIATDLGAKIVAEVIKGQMAL